MSPTRRVVKVGGSLFDLSDLADRLHRWLHEQSDASSVLVAGGGAAVDAVRRASDRYQVPEELAHEWALDAMSITGRVLRFLLGECASLDTFDELRETLSTASSPLNVVFDCREFLCSPPGFSIRLPSTWEVTSDSIAAQLAVAIQAEELVLLKSSLPTKGTGRREAVDKEYVDAYFVDASHSIPRVRFVDLRSSDFLELHAN